ncbi:ATP-dependent DNA helicase [Mycena indigotica]|uniref:ATP-dependent DNA helicase n=1 Tax=Mycena indigotica TaxID=2126181 RepID=A0A8H6WCG9_9AGAR|nr:ATP-dependent DNA helicase [Mycena indigotica]KAF7307359.1 ATP-dependent DNA helicase [Mycena indigotica]
MFLVPTHPHPRHTLTNGMLLHRTGETKEYICSQCRQQLIKGNRPPLSLANNMWIGAIPRELAVLTLSERLLVSIYFPAAYIIKLYPRHLGKRDEEKTTGAGLRGNVSSYRLNTDRISQMVDGAVRQEHASYVPADESSSDEDDDEGMGDDRERYTGHLPDNRGQNNGEDIDSDYEPDVFPIQASGVIDTGGEEVTDSDLFAHAAENIVPAFAAREYGVRKGSAFVNEYARTDGQGH